MASPDHDPHAPDDEDQEQPKPQPNATHRPTIKAAEKAAKARKLLIDEGIRAALETPHGRAFLSYILFDLGNIYGHIETTLFDTNAVHFFMGRRHVAVDVQNLALSLNKERYMLLLKEHLK